MDRRFTIDVGGIPFDGIKEWVELTSPDFGVAGSGISLCEHSDILYLAASSGEVQAPTIETYYLSGYSWTKMDATDVSFMSRVYDVCLCSFNGVLYLAAIYNSAPRISIYYLSGPTWVKMSDPNTIAQGSRVKLYEFNNTLYLAVGLNASPYIAIYYLSGSTWVKMDNPADSPGNQTSGIDMYSFNGTLYLATGSIHYSNPIPLKIYYLSGSTWIKMGDPAILPTMWVRAVSFCEFNDTLYLSVGHNGTPHITNYYLSGNAWAKMNDLDGLPTATNTIAYGAKLCVLNNILYLAVGYDRSPYMVIYYLSGSNWVAMGSYPSLAVSVSRTELCPHDNSLYLGVRASAPPFVNTYRGIT